MLKSCERPVERLLKYRHEKKLLHASGANPSPNTLTPSLRAALRLIVRDRRVECLLFAASALPPRSSSESPVTVHRYEEHIAGRTYLIEVSPVSQSRWRAQIARLPGMPTSLMPFYGPTPEDAKGELSRWLSLVYKGCGSS